MDIKVGDVVLLYNQTGSGQEVRPATVTKVTPTGRIQIKGMKRAYFNQNGKLMGGDILFGNTYIVKADEKTLNAYLRKAFRSEVYWRMINVEPNELTFPKAYQIAETMGWHIPRMVKEYVNELRNSD